DCSAELGKHHGAQQLGFEVFSRQLQQLASALFNLLDQSKRNIHKLVFGQCPVDEYGIALADRIRQRLPSAAAKTKATTRIVRRKLFEQLIVKFFILLNRRFSVSLRLNLVTPALYLLQAFELGRTTAARIA